MDQLGDQLPQIIALLRSLRDEGAQQLMPSLQGAALECVQHAIPVLDRLCTDLSMQPASADLQQQAERLFRDIDTRLGGAADNSETTLVMPTPVALQNALVVRLRTLAAMSRDRADLLPLLAGEGRDGGQDRSQVSLRNRPHPGPPPQAGEGTNADDEQESLLWRSAADLSASLRAAIESARLPAAAEALASEPAITPESLTHYLRQQWPDATELRVTSLQLLSGGRSKRTLFASLSGHPGIEQIALRQDVPTGMIDTLDGTTRVADELPLLRTAHAAGLPVAEPLWLEAETTALGPPFLITRKVGGVAPGDWRGFHQPDDALTRKAVEHLAETLARLHQLAPPQSGAVESTGQRMQREIAYRWNKWQQDALAPFPLIDCAFQRLREACGIGLGQAVLVHGDVLPHNLLFDQGRVTALLDWEFAHPGDPAEDLAYCRAAVSAVMPWAQFLDRYRSAGGPAVSERRLAIFGLYGLVRNSGLIASAGRLYAEGKVDDFTTGAIAYVSLPMMESLIGSQIKALDAADRDQTQ